jgi:ABC-type phosphate transport system substrate-binding protein
MNRFHLARCLAIAAIIGLAGTARAGDIVVVGNPAAAPLTKDQVAEIYTGKSQASTPLDQPESAAIRAEFYKKATGKDPSQIKALWSRLTFTGKGQMPPEVADAAAVKKAVAANPKAIGYIDKSAVDGTVKVLASID